MTNNIFEEIKKINEHWKEFWSARDLMIPLGYIRWENFEVAISRAKESCKNSKQNLDDHFRDVTKMVSIWSEAERKTKDYNLSRYACYLIAQNWDPRKEEIAKAQTYFALQTRKQEINEVLIEDKKRLFLRNEMTEHNKKLAKTAKWVWVWNYWEFTDYWYMWLYWGLKAKDIHTKKKLKSTERILDYMWSEELAANLFRATQAEAKLKRESIKWQFQANKAHLEVWKEVRQTIKKLWWTMPEKLPTAEAIKEAKKRVGKEKKWELK